MPNPNTGVEIGEEVDELRRELADARGQLCRAREALDSHPGGDPSAADVLGHRLVAVEKALSSSSPCAHEARVEELGGQLCRAREELRAEVYQHPSARRFLPPAEREQMADNILQRLSIDGPCPHESRVKELEDAAQTWKNAWSAACEDISKLQARLSEAEAREKRLRGRLERRVAKMIAERG